MPGAHLGITDEPKGTLGCRARSMPVTVLPAIPTGSTACSTAGPYQLSPLQMVMELVLEN